MAGLAVALSPARGREALRALFYRSALYRRILGRGIFGTRPVDEVRLVYPENWPEDEPAAEALLGGELLLAGRRLPVGRVPWTPPPAGVVAERLHGFAWLADLKAAGDEAAQVRARELVDGWIASNAGWSLPAWRADVLGRRLAAWLAASDFLLAGADDAFRQRFVQSAAVQARHHLRTAGQRSGDAGAIAAVAGRIAAVLCLGLGSLDAALEQLRREIDRQVLSDGGHVQRCPAVHLAVLRDLLGIRAALQSAQREPPLVLQGAIDRMTPMLRTFRLGDGGLALFNGGKEEDHRLIGAVLAKAGGKDKALASAPHTGFERLAAGRTAIVVDTGAPPPPGADRLAHAGPLAFEMSAGRNRIVVNCGTFVGDDPRWRAAMRSTLAHSTVTVDSASALAVAADGGLRHRRVRVTALRREADGAIWLEASHDGYRRRFGLVHKRRLYLAADGDDIRGEDELEGRGGRSFGVRFHLHPHVQASLTQDGTAVLLKPPTGRGWRFLAVGGRIGLDESAYLGVSDVPRRTEQIVVSGPLAGKGALVKWAFRREGDAG
ncbi:MAG: heparinase II/III family protein [Rhodospirillales bacterium]